MINVTDTAVRQLKTLLESKPDSSGKGLRVQIAKGGCSGLQYEMTLDKNGLTIRSPQKMALNFLSTRKARLPRRRDAGFSRGPDRCRLSFRQSERVSHLRLRHVFRSRSPGVKPDCTLVSA